jgi:hypothetical protein
MRRFAPGKSLISETRSARILTGWLLFGVVLAGGGCSHHPSAKGQSDATRADACLRRSGASTDFRGPPVVLSIRAGKTLHVAFFGTAAGDVDVIFANDDADAFTIAADARRQVHGFAANYGLRASSLVGRQRNVVWVWDYTHAPDKQAQRILKRCLA